MNRTLSKPHFNPKKWNTYGKWEERHLYINLEAEQSGFSQKEEEKKKLTYATVRYILR